MTRVRLAAAALGAGAALADVPAAPASASCEPVVYELTGECTSPCKPANVALRALGLDPLDCNA